MVHHALRGFENLVTPGTRVLETLHVVSLDVASQVGPVAGRVGFRTTATSKEFLL